MTKHETQAFQNRREGQVSPAKLAHIVLRTPRYDEMIAWYIKVLDASLAFGTPLISFITYDDEHHRVAFVNMPQIGDCDPMAAGLDHVAFTYGSLRELIATYERLKKDDLIPGWCINHGPTTSLYYKDPDGNQVEAQIDCMSVEDSIAFMASEAFSANPIGIDVDFDALIARRRGGEGVASLIDYATSGV